MVFPYVFEGGKILLGISKILISPKITFFFCRTLPKVANMVQMTVKHIYMLYFCPAGACGAEKKIPAGWRRLSFLAVKVWGRDSFLVRDRSGGVTEKVSQTTICKKYFCDHAGARHHIVSRAM